MPSVQSSPEIELRPATDPEEFERATAEVASSVQPEGRRTLVLKGERGPRSGNYLMIFEIDSLEARNRLYPEEGHAHQEENERFDQEHPESAAAWQRLSAMIVDLAVATDYVVIASEHRRATGIVTGRTPDRLRRGGLIGAAPPYPLERLAQRARSGRTLSAEARNRDPD